MIHAYVSDAGRLRVVDGLFEPIELLVWIDLLDPTPAEESAVEERLGIDIPTREEMSEIEISSRLYTEEDAVFMTAMLLSKVDADDPLILPVTFVLSGHRLITVRYHEPRAFRTFPARAGKVPMGCDSGEGVLLALLEGIVDRLADILEHAHRETDEISGGIFRRRGAKPTSSRDFQLVLEKIGRKGDLASDIRESLVTLDRLIGFFGQVTLQRKAGKDARERLKTLGRDVRSLADYVTFLSQQITFLLDATLGMINIEQNGIIKVLSVAAVVFLPPTLIASVYGMNFSSMPELDNRYGYPMAIGLMVVTAILPYLYFKYRDWL